MKVLFLGKDKGLAEFCLKTKNGEETYFSINHNGVVFGIKDPLSIVIQLYEHPQVSHYSNLVLRSQGFEIYTEGMFSKFEKYITREKIEENIIKRKLDYLTLVNVTATRFKLKELV